MKKKRGTFHNVVVCMFCRGHMADCDCHNHQAQKEEAAYARA